MTSETLAEVLHSAGGEGSDVIRLGKRVYHDPQYIAKDACMPKTLIFYKGENEDRIIREIH